MKEVLPRAKVLLTLGFSCKGQKGLDALASGQAAFFASRLTAGVVAQDRSGSASFRSATRLSEIRGKVARTGAFVIVREEHAGFRAFQF